MKIVILEDNADRQAEMRACLADRFYTFEPHFFESADAMICFLDQHQADTIVIALDHDLEMLPRPDGRCVDPGTGRLVADYLAGKKPTCPVVIHTTNSAAAVGMETVLREAGWKMRRVVPCGDMEWIGTTWFRAMRRAIVGPIARNKALASAPRIAHNTAASSEGGSHP